MNTHMHVHSSRRTAGFTMIEMIGVLAIIAQLSLRSVSFLHGFPMRQGG